MSTEGEKLTENQRKGKIIKVNKCMHGEIYSTLHSYRSVVLNWFCFRTEILN